MPTVWTSWKRLASTEAQSSFVRNGIENTLHRRARELGLQYSTVAREAGLPPEVVQRAKRLAPDNAIEDLERIGFVLGLDELRLGYQPPATGDDALAVRAEDPSTYPG